MRNQCEPDNHDWEKIGEKQADGCWYECRKCGKVEWDP